MAVFLLKIQRLHSKWKILEKIVMYDRNLAIIDTKTKNHRVLYSLTMISCFQTNLQHNYPGEKRRTTIRNVTGNADDASD